LDDELLDDELWELTELCEDKLKELDDIDDSEEIELELDSNSSATDSITYRTFPVGAVATPITYWFGSVQLTTV